MYILSKKFTFEASHQLKKHDGKCARLHGHSWVMWVAVTGEPREYSEFEDSADPKTNMVMDYGDLKAIVNPLVKGRLDHWHLNDTLGTDSPTSEFVARYCADEIATLLRKQGEAVKLLWVKIEETCTSSCTYYAYGYHELMMENEG